jgi:serine/threonine-protein kinase
LGEGGFSLTYRGIWKTEVQGALGKLPTDVPVCIKEFFFKDYCQRNPQTFFIETNNETAQEIFEKNKEKVIREARILSEIHHPNVVNVLEVFKQNNTAYIVMEFIAGHSLKQEIEQNGVFTENKLRPVIYKIGQALEYIHEKNILHLDIKPSNILITKNNNPKLIDFGISKRYDLTNDQETSATLQAASKGYASIEQYDSEAMQVFSPRPDVYSLGATMYFLLTGQIPTESILRASKGLQRPKELNPAISENTEKVILKAMEPNASDRYETVMEMLLDWGFDPDKDTIDRPSIPDDEDNAELMKKINEPLYDADAEDQTLITPLSIDKKRKEKRKKRTAYLVFIFLVCSTVILVIRAISNHSPIDEQEIEPNLAVTESPAKPANTIIQPESDQIPAEIPAVDPNPENYNKAFNNALAAFNAQDYEKAVEFINEAESYRITADTKRYKKRCTDELEKIETQKRKNSYESMMKFGNFAVVKNKATGLYGAIDDKGNEVIECIYINTESSGTNRLFQISDDLYDLYDASGKLLATGISGLE